MSKIIPNLLPQHLVDKALACLGERGDDPKNQVETRAATFEHPQWGEFLSIGICPSKPGTFFAVDMLKLTKEFAPDSLAVSNYEKTTEGIRSTPHVRLLRDYGDFVLMMDIYMEPVKLES